MALKPTIYKLKISLSDLNREYYDTLNLTVARHPSESLPRMAARVLAYCHNATDLLTFCRGLSEADEPDIWARSLDDQLLLWIDVGEPAVERIKKASRRARQVKVYSFNSKSGVWWEQNKAGFAELPVAVYRFDWDQVNNLAGLFARTMEFSLMLSGDSAFVSTESGECEVSGQLLQAANH